MYKLTIDTFECREATGERCCESQDFYDRMQEITKVSQEVFGIFTLNQKNQIIDRHIVHMGTVTQVIVHPREVYRHAIADGAVSIVLMHNHPSGDLTPSREDKSLTTRMVEAGKIIGIPVLDHLIVSSNGYFSFVDEGIL